MLHFSLLVNAAAVGVVAVAAAVAVVNAITKSDQVGVKMLKAL